MSRVKFALCESGMSEARPEIFLGTSPLQTARISRFLVVIVPSSVREKASALVRAEDLKHLFIDMLFVIRE